jgi:diacylglycerol kinase family enzyme
LRTAWELFARRKENKSNLIHKQVSKSIRNDAVGNPRTTQGDGEPLGEMPVDVSLVPKAIKVIVPENVDKEK